jgi:hypothetical protein
MEQTQTGTVADKRKPIVIVFVVIICLFALIGAGGWSLWQINYANKTTVVGFENSIPIPAEGRYMLTIEEGQQVLRLYYPNGKRWRTAVMPPRNLNIASNSGKFILESVSKWDIEPKVITLIARVSPGTEVAPVEVYGGEESSLPTDAQEIKMDGVDQLLPDIEGSEIIINDDRTQRQILEGKRSI